MYLILGQLNKPANDIVLQELIARLSRKHLIITRCNIDPLSWALKISFSESEYYSLKDNEIFRFIRHLASAIGLGEYVFRGFDRDVDNFWTTDSSSICDHDRFINGIPLTLSLNKSVVFTFDTSWLNKFVETNSMKMLPVDCEFERENVYRRLFGAIDRLLSLDGKWTLKSRV